MIKLDYNKILVNKIKNSVLSPFFHNGIHFFQINKAARKIINSDIIELSNEFRTLIIAENACIESLSHLSNYVDFFELNSYVKREDLSFEQYELVVVMGGGLQRRKIEGWIINDNPTVYMIDFNDLLMKHGIYIDFDWYQTTLKANICSIKKTIFAFVIYLCKNQKIRRLLGAFHLIRIWIDKLDVFSEQYVTYKCLLRCIPSMKSVYLQKLIFYSLENRDFLSFYEFVDQYAEQKYEKYELFLDLKSDINSLLDELKKETLKKADACIINWIDNIGIMRLKDMPFLNDKCRTGLTFEKAYTSMPWTTFTMKSIFYGKPAIEGELYKYKKIDSKSKLIRIFENKNYSFFYSGSSRFQKSLFKRKLNAYFDNSRSVFEASTKYQWYALCELAKAENKVALLIHNMYETHMPYWSPKLEYFEVDTPMSTDQQKENAANWLDLQLQWYDQFYNCNSHKIYISDHGDPYQYGEGDLPRYSEKRLRILVLISDISENEGKTIPGLFPIYELSTLIGRVLNKEMNFDDLAQEYVKIQIYDTYAKNNVNEYLKNGADCREWMQVQAVITLREKYLKFYNGENMLFRLNDMQEEIEECDGNEEKIQGFEARLDNYIVIDDIPFFKYSRKLYSK